VSLHYLVKTLVPLRLTVINGPVFCCSLYLVLNASRLTDCCELSAVKVSQRPHQARALRFSPVCSIWFITRTAASGILVPVHSNQQHHKLTSFITCLQRSSPAMVLLLTDQLSTR